MNGKQFRSALNIAGYCLTLANEDIQDASEHSGSPETAKKLQQIHESLDDCVVIIDALKRYLETHSQLPTPEMAPFKHCL